MVAINKQVEELIFEYNYINEQINEYFKKINK